MAQKVQNKLEPKNNQIEENEEFLYRHFSGLNPESVEKQASGDFLRMNAETGKHKELFKRRMNVEKYGQKLTD